MKTTSSWEWRQSNWLQAAEYVEGDVQAMDHKTGTKLSSHSTALCEDICRQDAHKSHLMPVMSEGDDKTVTYLTRYDMHSNTAP